MIDCVNSIKNRIFFSLFNYEITLISVISWGKDTGMSYCSCYLQISEQKDLLRRFPSLVKTLKSVVTLHFKVK